MPQQGLDVPLEGAVAVPAGLERCIGDDRKSQLRNALLLPRHGVPAIHGFGERELYPCVRLGAILNVTPEDV